jgi:hypothetical protein
MREGWGRRDSGAGAGLNRSGARVTEAVRRCLIVMPANAGIQAVDRGAN